MDDLAGTHDILVALDVSDEAMYQQYRDEMAPMLRVHGGKFRHDFRVSDTLHSEAGESFNRVFVLSFPDAAAAEAFFQDPDYLLVRERYFKPSVQQAAILAQYFQPEK